MKDVIAYGVLWFSALLSLLALIPHLRMRYKKDFHSTPWPFHQRLRNKLRGIGVMLFTCSIFLGIVAAVVFVIGVAKDDPHYALRFLRSNWPWAVWLAFYMMFIQFARDLDQDASESENFEQLTIRRLGQIERKLQIPVETWEE